MSDEANIDSQLEKPKGGAAIHMHDGRVSKALGWFWGVVGASIAGGSLLAANNLYQLNLAVNRMTDNSAAVAIQLNDHEGRLRQMERDVSTLEGKVYRGVAGYEIPVQPRGPRGR